MNDWGVYEADNGRHVIPRGDLKPHRFHACWCRPFEEDGITVHNSMDKREIVERGYPAQ